ncbi:hypothetical protein C1645_777151 [Glomus cerebriforme]|uniref:Uncharacterized protein n=1 Tax=Glomus cerebriforme TaxID=658196 RepID=A0A397SP85_9GLOM|nr:hypothetical protein C1645_777151 [Glomus cerebriforme]
MLLLKDLVHFHFLIFEPLHPILLLLYLWSNLYIYYYLYFLSGRKFLANVLVLLGVCLYFQSMDL